MMILRPYTDCPQDIIPLKLEILPLRQRLLTPHTWFFHEGKLLHNIFPAAPFSIRRLKFSQEASPFFQFPDRTGKESLTGQNILDQKSLKIVQLKRTPPYYFNLACNHAISGLTLPYIGRAEISRKFLRYKGTAKPSLTCLNLILKQAKNLASLTLGPKCENSTFRGIRKLRKLEYLSLNLSSEQIISYPELFKGLINLKEVRLIVYLEAKNIEILTRFFEALLSLPKLQHVTILLDDTFSFYKALLSTIHAKNLPSFLIAAYRAHQKDQDLKISHTNSCVDTLYIGPMNPAETFDQPRFQSCSEVKKPERKLYVVYEKLVEENLELLRTVKSLTIVDWVQYAGQDSLKFIPEMKSLENFTIGFAREIKNLELMIQKLSSKEGFFENLPNLTIDLKDVNKHFPKLFFPFWETMKSLKTLSIRLECFYLDQFDFLENLGGLVSLEDFKFKYTEICRRTLPQGIDCDFSLEGLKNLKSLNFDCNIAFVGNARAGLIQAIENEKLEFLVVRERVFDGLEGENIEKLVGILNSKKRLEAVRLNWWNKVENNLEGKRIRIEKVNGEIVLSEEVGRIGKEK